MKKLLVTLTAVAMLVMSIAAVSAAEVVTEDETFTSNMDAETFLETRLERLDEALESGLITQEQYDLMVEHMTENAEAGIFGRGPNGLMQRRADGTGFGGGRGRGQGLGLCH